MMALFGLEPALEAFMHFHSLASTLCRVWE